MSHKDLVSQNHTNRVDNHRFANATAKKDGDTRTDLLSGPDLHYAFFVPGCRDDKDRQSAGSGAENGSQSVSRGSRTWSAVYASERLRPFLS